MKKMHSLFDLPSILFYGYLKNLGIRETKEFTFIYHGKHEVNCKYAILKTARFEEPTLVYIDLRNHTGIDTVQVLLLEKLPKISPEGKVESLICNRSIVVAKTNDDLILTANLGYLGFMEFNDVFIKLTNRYLLSLTQMTIELDESKKYDWVRSISK